MSDAQTLKTYADMATKYADMTGTGAVRDITLVDFLAQIPPGGHLLDLGCGPGHSAAVMAQNGFVVTAMDAVAEMVAMADAQEGVTAQHATFDDIAGIDIYDGIWANFSLLHAARADMPRHLKAIHTALKPGGTFHIALKSGTGSKRDNINRLYTYYTSTELSDLLAQAGFTVTDHASGNSMGMDGEPADWIAVRARG